MDKRVATQMKKARKNRKLTLKEVAVEFGVGENTISNWETGKSTPSIDNFIKYCEVCGVNCGDLLNEAVGDPTKFQSLQCTPEEKEMIKKYRELDERGMEDVQETIERNLRYVESAGEKRSETS